MSLRIVLPILFLCLTTGVILTACWPSSKHHSDASIAFLASDAYVLVGDVPLVLPYVALTGLVGKTPSLDRQAAKERLEAFRKSADSRETAPAVDQLEVTLTTYGLDDFDPSAKRICSRLKRQWSRSICEDPSSPIRQAMPKGNFFNFVDDRKLDEFQEGWFPSSELLSDRLDKMRLKRGEVSVVCKTATHSETPPCIAAVSIKQHLAAVWKVSSSAAQPPSMYTKQEADAIMAFVDNALGPTENFPDFFAEICKLEGSTGLVAARGNPCHHNTILEP